MYKKINNIVIGIAGRRNSGKDTVASMINYILNTTPEDCTYSKYKNNKKISNNYFSNTITHFADDLKFIVCNLFGIGIKEANDRTYKDKLWFCIKERKFYTKKSIPNGYYEIDIFATDKSLAQIIDETDGKCVIKLRQLLQYFGTDICRKNLYDNIWIDSCIARARRFKNSYGYCIIPDVRFKNEAKAINEFNYDGSYSKGRIILVERDNECKDEHTSEIIDVDHDYYIYNNGTLEDLFDKIKYIIKNLEDEYN